MVSSGLAVQFVLSAVCMIAALAAAPILPRFFDAGETPVRVFVFAFLAAAAARAVSFPGQVLSRYLGAHQRVAENYYIGLAARIAEAGAAVGLLRFGWGLMALPFAAFAGQVVTVGATLWRIRRVSPELRLSPRLAQRDWFGKLMRFGVWGLLARFSSSLIASTDNLVIAYFLGPASVTAYVLTRRVLILLQKNVLQRFNNVLRPGIGDLLGRGAVDTLQTAFVQGLRGVVGVALCGGILLGFMSRRFVSAWVGPANFGGDALVWITVASVVALSIFHYASVFVTGALQIRVIAQVRFVEAALNLGFSVLFVKIGLGIAGVALGTLLASVLTSSWYLLWRSFGICGMKAGAWLVPVAARSFGLAAAVAAACWLAAAIPGLSAASFLSLALWTVVAGLVVLPAACAIGLTPSERAWLRDYLAARLTWVRHRFSSAVS